ncbi:hypothetical protein EST38_g3550 [Candolleomyces aberdarensis]|uniref:Sacsin/Nov domain-containing protein n=1 Tax=Candolleomyces aberdarensis TaxID=2316362 RepID=A0A4Q2DQH9_9AGAR|nr:hypothetical protein EST38_g3550 [Candolleomyces aberdarensis]
MTTSSAFGENVDRLGSIRSILDNYPFSAGLLREILQNSDDAKATEQTFLLDCCKHPTERICHPSIADTQGPALLAFNNAKFLPDDWVALQIISKSSKREDTSKIGKFGIGIRSCYHVTDFLQILSGGDLVIFDPQSSFSVAGGARFAFTPETIKPIRDHLQAFEYFLPSNWNGEALDGTVVRLPLRTKPGELREKIVSPEEIKQLFQEFIEKELTIAMLFLQHLRSIDFIIIDQAGRVKKIAHCTVAIAGQLSVGVCKQVVSVQSAEAKAKEEWLVVHQKFTKDDVLKLFSDRTGSLSENVLKKHKLRAEVGLAFPLNPTQNIELDIGQLFTFLRLPIKTGFPAHIHSLFSLTPSRQNLRPHGENGIVKGSDDYILIEWNKLLFDVYIPRVWTHLLTTITIHSPTTPIFSAWPVAQHFTESDSAYWASFPNNVLDTVLQTDAIVWPIIGQDVYKRLQDVFVARPNMTDEVVQALADTGMSVCRPPEHLFRMIEALPKWNHHIRILTPESTSTALRDNFASNLLNAPAERRATILQYLLSSNNIRNIVGLQIIPTVSGSFVSLAQQGTTSNTYTLLESSNVEVFRACDDNAIFIDDLPPSTQEMVRQQAPRSLNVKILDPDQVVKYLGLHPTRRGLELSQTEADAPAVAFLSTFWTWLDSWGPRSPLLPKLASEYVLPCAGGLRRAIRNKPAFDATEIPAFAACLSGFGVPFVSDALTSEARTVLKKYGFLKSATDMHALLDAVEAVGGPVSDQTAQLLFNHFSQHMVKSTWHSFSGRQKTVFRQLPIFPIVEYDANAQVRCRRAAVNGLAVYGVGSFNLLPVLPNAVFVNLKVLDPRLLPLLNESQNRPLSDIDVLALSVKRLDQQHKKHLALMLRHIASHQPGLTYALKQSLRSERYAYSSLGTREAPQTLIDPSSLLHPLYINDKKRLHSSQDEEDRSIAESLAKLKLLDKAMSAGNIIDRIQHIASNASFEDAIKLLNIIYDHGFNCRSLALDKSSRWLPTQKETLAAAAECRPGKGTTSEELHLFDKVLELVHSRAMVSPSLRTVLGWDDPIPVDVLLEQFREVLDNPEADVYHRVKNLIKELSSRRDLTTEQWSSLHQLLENREWVPTSEHTLVESWQAVFSSSFQGVYMVAPDLSIIGSESRDFLTELNCLTSPSFDTVTKRLSQLYAEPPGATVTSSAIATLRFAASLALTKDQHSQLLVPDDLDHLQPIQDVIFNDVGTHSLLLPRNEVCLASSSIDDALARALGLQRLGLKHVHLQTLGEDMGVTPATIVEKTLAQYTEKQFLPEFLANAQDAGASKLIIILNNYTSVEGNFLSPDLGKLHGPSVMVYNDSEFSENDFEGICKTHIGGKAGNPDSIGQFGLGALTMFHITECAVIYSGDKVLFLDPSKSYLPIAGRASLLMPLKDLDRFYPGHTSYLKGLEFFDPQTCRVDGTIFFLPLRSSSSTSQGKKTLVPTVYSIDTFRKTILRDFHAKADECLLFIKVNDIEAQMRTSDQSKNLLWSLTASRTETAFDGLIETKISIDSCALSSKKTSSEWLTMSATVQAPDVPQECKEGVGSKKIKVGLAAPLSDEHRPQCRFFSMLPLAIPTTLPVHVNASFRMSPDRRQMRLDNYDNDDTRFNRWLLKMQIPPLYLALLERIAQERDNTRWWPGDREDVSLPEDEDEDQIITAHEDALTSILTESLYSTHLPESSRRIFYPMYSGGTLKFSDAILHSTKPPSPVRRVMDLLRPQSIVKATTPVRARLRKAGLVTIDPSFISQLLLNDHGAERVQEHLGHDEVGGLLVWLSQEQGVHLRGLPLLYLENKTWVKFGTEGQVYYSSPSSSRLAKDDFLPSGRFVHQDTMPSGLLEILSTSTIQVAELDAAGVRQLVEEKLKTLDSQAKESWIKRFWKVYPTFPKDGLLKSIENLALVPTLSGTSFKSLTECKESALLTDKIDTIEDTRRVECFRDLGIDVVPLDLFPPALSEALRHGDYSPKGSQFDHFLRCISPIIDSAVQSFKLWQFDRRKQFSRWVRNNIRSKVPDEHIQILRKLPVWPARRGLEIDCMCSANQVTLLPPNISVDVGRFCRNYVTAHEKTSHLGLQRLTLPQLYRILDLPQKLLPGEDEKIYRNLLTLFLSHSNRDMRRIQVPNAARVMVYCDNLFERTPFFIAAFGESSDRFLLRSFDSFASGLYSRGLKCHTDLDLDLFSECAHAFQDEYGRVVRADVPLELHVPFNQAGGWQSLDNIRFIPRNMHEGRRYMSREIELPESIRNLPQLVSPRQVVRNEFHGIAWTQRVPIILQHEPLKRLSMVFPDFGTPSANEVVAHLKELALLSLSHGSVVLPDLKATYAWLNEHTSCLGSLRPELQGARIFLNVDDPSSETWRWSTARQMAFGTRDVGQIQGVRQFLSSFPDLLKAAGVLEAFYPEIEEDDDVRTPDERDLLSQCRDGFSRLRATNRLVDVVFTPEEEDSSPGITVRNVYFEDLFTGGYADSQGDQASDNGLLNISLPASSFAIKTALDYLYTGQVLDREESIELEDLLQTLELSRYLQIDGLFRLAQREVVERELVDPLNLSDVRNRAAAIDADALTRWCDKYETRNREYISVTTG